MRVGIITCWSSADNYGQQLQCWALQRKLSSMGHYPYLIRYQRVRPRKPLASRLLTMGPMEIVARVGNRIIPSRRQRRKIELAEESRMQSKSHERGFEEFRESHLALSPRTWNNIEELRNDPPDADVYLAGSDQVWYDPLDEPDVAGMYLDFGATDTRRIAYAASIGRDITAKEDALFDSLTRRFDAISVRERNAAERLQRAGLQAPVTVDPTLLLERSDYSSLLEDGEDQRPFDSGYMLIYGINVPNAEALGWTRASKYVSTSGLSVLAVYSSGYVRARELISDVHTWCPTIPEWLRAIRDADCVLTSSYHGVVFSILFHKRFIAVPLPGNHARANERLTTLLTDVGLDDRILTNDADFRKAMEQDVDWNSVDERLNKIRERSSEILKAELEGTPLCDI